MDNKGRQTSLTDHDREYLASLTDAQTSTLKSDVRWIKLLSAFALSVFGYVLIEAVPVVKDLHSAMDTLNNRLSSVEIDAKVIKTYQEVIMKHKWDHLKCHFKPSLEE